MIRKNILKISILLLFSFLQKQTNGQILHHQMLSTMGSTTTMKSGMIVMQTLGQQSVIGNATGTGYTVQQGYQQSLLSRHFPTYSINTIATTVYPNPFSGIVNISFSQSISGEMNIGLYNMFGVLIQKDVRQDSPLTISYNFEYLPTGSYVIHITAKNYTYSKTLIKQ